MSLLSTFISVMLTFIMADIADIVTCILNSKATDQWIFTFQIKYKHRSVTDLYLILVIKYKHTQNQILHQKQANQIFHHSYQS